jgi:hypothetical protein
MLKKILLVVVALLAILVVLGFTQPADYRVERSLVMAAPPQAVYDQVADFRKWQAWSPWTKRDPGMKTTIGGTPAGKGATWRWEAAEDAGTGSMTITEATAPGAIAIDLVFSEPFESRVKVGFGFKPEGAGTHVTWWMSGTHNFVGRMLCVFMDMDKMVGRDFEEGLASIQAIVEAPAPAK